MSDVIQNRKRHILAIIEKSSLARHLSCIKQIKPNVCWTQADILALATSIFAYVSFTVFAWVNFSPFIYGEKQIRVDFFQADIYDFLGLLYGKSYSSARYAIHPLIAPILIGPARFAEAVFSDPRLGFLIVLVSSSALSAALLFVLVRGIGAATAPSVLAVLAAGSSVAFTHWAGVPESYPLAISTIAAPLALLAASRSTGIVTWTCVIGLAGSITVTNFISGMISALVRLGFSRAFFCSVLALIGLVFLNWVTLPEIPSLLPLADIRAIIYTALASYIPIPGSTQTSVRQMMAISYPYDFWERIVGILVVPGVALQPATRSQYWPHSGVIYEVLYYKDISLNALGVFGGIALLSWVGLLILCSMSARYSGRSDVAFASIGFLVFHFLLHLVYGELTQLYAAHILPSVTALFGFGLSGHLSGVCFILLCLYTVTAAPHNVARFLKSVAIASGDVPS